MIFRQRQKKYYPRDVFVAFPLRVAAIVHLCLVFTFLASIMSQPFMGDLFTIKSKKLLYENAMGTRETGDKEHMTRNTLRFALLPQSEQEILTQNYQHLQESLKTSFVDKLSKGVRLLFLSLSIYEQIWLLLSVILPVLLLKRIEGASEATWLLPILALLFCFDNRINGMQAHPTNEERLFPTETILMNEYLREPLSMNIFEQQEQLKKAWGLYLIKTWAKEVPAIDSKERHQQEESGEFAFTIARLLAEPTLAYADKIQGPRRHPLFLLGLFLTWNVILALQGRKAVPHHRLTI
jgi:hypothetical protein